MTQCFAFNSCPIPAQAPVPLLLWCHFNCLLQVLLVLLLSCFSWKLAPRMGGTKGVLSQVVAALELRVAQGMWLSPEPRGAASAAATAAETH